VPPTYSLYGLTLRSEVPLPCPEVCPEVQSSQDDTDVDLVESTEDQLAGVCHGAPTSLEDDGFWRCAIYQSGAARVCWKDHFDFVVAGDGGRVLWRRLVDVPDEVLFTYLLGQVLSFCLLARGLEPLHATSVLVNGSAIAFLGDTGDGKSTLAATLLERGHRLITDDVLVVHFDGHRALAYPSLARIKLMPDSADAVLRGRRSVPMNRFTRKMIFPLAADQLGVNPAPLRALYLLPPESSQSSQSGDSSHSSVAIRRLGGRTAFLSVIRHTFNDSVLHPRRLRQQFLFAGRLLKTVPVNTLCYPRRLDVLPAVVEAILADLKGSDLVE
jgi:hypothetical protein